MPVRRRYVSIHFIVQERIGLAASLTIARVVTRVEITTKNENIIDEIDRPQAAEQLKSRLIVASLCIVLSAIVVAPFFFMGRSEDGASPAGLRMPTTHDMFLHYDQMRSFYEGLRAGAVYPRWEEDTNRGFGAPTTSYYPPGVYYVTSGFYAVTRSWIEALLGTHLLMMMMSAGAIYWYARRVMSRVGAVAAMAAYVVGPYHLIDQYQRGAIAELMGFVFMPVMLMCAEELMEKRRAGGVAEGEEGEQRRRRAKREVWAVAGVAMSYGGFVWTHPPTAYQFSIGFGMYVVMMSVMRREWRGMVKVGAGVMMGVGLAAAYIIPAALEQNLINKEYITTTWPYHNTYVFVHELFNYNIFVDFFRRLDMLWIFGCVIIIVAAIALLFFTRQSESDLKQRVILWVTLGCLASFMMHRFSKPVGRLIPNIEIGVFTWRMLSITTLVISLLTGACAHVAVRAIKDKQRKASIVCGSLCLVVLIGGAMFSALFVVAPTRFASVFVPEEEHLNPAMIPVTAPVDLGELPDDVPPAELAEDSGEVVIEKWSPEHRIVKVDLEDADQLWIRAFNFPGWTATVDGQPAQITNGEELGDIEIDLDAGVHEVRLDYLDTPIRRKAERVTIACFGLLVMMVVVPLFVPARRW